MIMAGKKDRLKVFGKWSKLSVCFHSDWLYKPSPLPHKSLNFKIFCDLLFGLS